MIVLEERLTQHFTIGELCVSQDAARLGIDNTPPPEIVRNLLRLAALLERVRALLGNAPILVSSGYRCPALNAKVGGSKGSAHMAGLAADFTAPGYGNVYKTARTIAESEIEYDQLIHEFGAWIHIGLSSASPRRQNLSIFKGTGYLAGIIERAPASA